MPKEYSVTYAKEAYAFYEEEIMQVFSRALRKLCGADHELSFTKIVNEFRESLGFSNFRKRANSIFFVEDIIERANYENIAISIKDAERIITELHDELGEIALGVIKDKLNKCFSVPLDKEEIERSNNAYFYKNIHTKLVDGKKVKASEGEDNFINNWRGIAGNHAWVEWEESDE